MDYRLEQLRFELREDPSSRVFFKLGEHLRREGELQEAITVLGNGLEQHPKYVAAWVSLGRALLDAGLTRRAADALGRALALDPENAVASRHAGEAAIANGEWVEAIKGLKRARALSAPEEALDERIAFVEARLAELGQLEASARPAELPTDARVSSPPAGRSLDVVFAEAEGDAFSQAGADDVFLVDAAEDHPAGDDQPFEDDGRSTMAIPLERMPIPSGAGGEFTDAPSEELRAPENEPLLEIDADAVIESEVEYDFGGDTGNAFDAQNGGVDALAPEPEPAFNLETERDPVVAFEAETTIDADVESATMPVSVAEIEAEIEPEPVFDLVDEGEDPIVVGVETESGSESEADFDFDDEEEYEDEARAEELPLPTMTLARLALDQADLDLAEKTLRGVLERNPNHTEAAELLAGLTSGVEEGPVTGGPASDDSGNARARALQRWLEAVRLASERLKT